MVSYSIRELALALALALATKLTNIGEVDFALSVLLISQLIGLYMLYVICYMLYVICFMLFVI